MAKIKRTDIWNGLKVDVVTDTDTGIVEVFQYNSTNVLAFADGPNWSIVNDGLFANLYNANKEVKLSANEVSQTFFNGGTRQFNKVRADVLNDNENYSSLIDANQSQITFQGFVKIPGIINPVSGLVNDDEGNASTAPIFAVPVIPNTSGVTGVSLYEGANQYIDPTINFDTSGLTGFDPGLTFLGDSLSSAETNQTISKIASNDNPRLVYPESNLSEYGYDYIEFSAYEYKVNNQSLFETGSFESLLASSSERANTGKPKGTVILPIQQPAADRTSVSWTENNLSVIDALFADAGSGVINAALKNNTIGDILAGGLGALGDTAKKAISTYINNRPEIEKQIKAYFIGQAIGNNNLIARATGQVLNSNMELLFSSIKLKSFGFNFTLVPRTDGEVKTIKTMIKLFKRNMSPGTSAQRLFLDTPNVFKIRYVYTNGDEEKDHPYLNRFTTCALTDFDVQYNSQGSGYMTYDDGAITDYNLRMTFSELKPIYQSDQELSDDTMGY